MDTAGLPGLAVLAGVPAGWWVMRMFHHTLCRNTLVDFLFSCHSHVV